MNTSYGRIDCYLEYTIECEFCSSVKHKTRNCNNDSITSGRDEITYFIYNLIPIEKFYSWVSKKDYNLLKMMMYNVYNYNNNYTKDMLNDRVLDYITAQKELHRAQKNYGISFIDEGKTIIMNYNSDLSLDESNYIPIPYPFDIYYKNAIRKDSLKLPHMTNTVLDLINHFPFSRD